jgi:hypothetical protein
VIDFRYHIVSIVAIFFALGAGVLLGAGPLRDTAAKGVSEQAQRDRQALENAREDLIDAKALDKYRDDYVSKVASGMTAARLRDRKVAIVRMPQAEDKLVDDISTELEAAGAQITTKVSLDSDLFTTEQRPLLDPLVNQLITADVTFGKDSTTFERAGQILARAIASKDDGKSVDEDASRILGGLTGTKLFSVKPTPKDRATLVVVVAGKAPSPAPDDSTYSDEADLAAGLDAGSAGVVVAGTPASAQHGLLKTLRADSGITKIVSSVDVADLPSGRATVVFALVEQTEGKAGQYGGVDAKNGVAPAAVLATGR